MKKFLQIFFALMLAATLICGCVVNSAVPNQTESTETQTATVTTTNVLTTVTTTNPTATLAPSPTPEVDPYIFSGNVDDVDFSYGPMSLVFTEGALSEVYKTEYREIHAELRSPKNLGEFNSTSEALAVGTGAGLTRPEQYGNMLLLLHSAYYAKKPLQAEALRFFLERWGKSGTEYVEQKLAEIVGSEGTLTINGNSVKVEITAGVRLKHEEAVEMQLHPELVLDIVTKRNSGEYIAIGNPQAFEDQKSNGDRALLITFCGWAPDDSEEKYTYYRYVLLLKVYQTSDNIN